MIWNDRKLIKWAKNNVSPFDINMVNPASIDLRIGNMYRIPTKYGWSEQINGDGGITIPTGSIYLLHSLEFTELPNNAVAFLFLKSSSGRRGIEHLHAGYGDPGFKGQWTLEIINHWPFPVKLIPGERILQLVLCDTGNDIIRTYDRVGHYQNQKEATIPWQWNKKGN